MIRAIVFDLDGTLIQSEKLKAQSYAIAVQRLRGLPEPDPRAIEAYRTIVGASREVASRFVMHELGLEQHLRPLMPQYSASGSAWRRQGRPLTDFISKIDERVMQELRLREVALPCAKR